MFREVLTLAVCLISTENRLDILCHNALLTAVIISAWAGRYTSSTDRPVLNFLTVAVFFLP